MEATSRGSGRRRLVTSHVKPGLLFLSVLLGLGCGAPSAGAPPNTRAGERTPTSADSGPPATRRSYASGEEILEEAARRYGLHPFYRRAYAFGYGSRDCWMSILLPVEFYDCLSVSERQLLVEYLERCIEEARSDPWEYIHNLPRTAPFSPIAEENVRGIQRGAWAITVGRVRGQDIDQTVEGAPRTILAGDLSLRELESEGAPEKAPTSDAPDLSSRPVWERIFYKRYYRLPTAEERSAFEQASGDENARYNAAVKVAGPPPTALPPQSPGRSVLPPDQGNRRAPAEAWTRGLSPTEVAVTRNLAAVSYCAEADVLRHADKTVSELAKRGIRRSRAQTLLEIEKLVMIWLDGMDRQERETGKRHPDRGKNWAKIMADQLVELAKDTAGERR